MLKASHVTSVRPPGHWHSPYVVPTQIGSGRLVFHKHVCKVVQDRAMGSGAPLFSSLFVPPVANLTTTRDSAPFPCARGCIVSLSLSRRLTRATASHRNPHRRRLLDQSSAVMGFGRSDVLRAPGCFLIDRLAAVRARARAGIDWTCLAHPGLFGHDRLQNMSNSNSRGVVLADIITSERYIAAV